MSAISVRLPESLHEAVRELAQRENVSALKTEEYLSARAQRGNRAKFEAALSKVADLDPEAHVKVKHRI